MMERMMVAVLLCAVLAGCGLSANAGSAKGALGIPVTVAHAETPAGGEATVSGKQTGAPLFSVGWAVYWPNVFAETVAWFQHSVPDFATMLLGNKAPAPAVPVPAAG